MTSLDVTVEPLRYEPLGYDEVSTHPWRPLPGMLRDAASVRAAVVDLQLPELSESETEPGEKSPAIPRWLEVSVSIVLTASAIVAVSGLTVFLSLA